VTPSLNPEELFPGMMFNIAKPALESTKLWKIIQKMPKGALLHCHLGAMVDLEWVFAEAIETEGLCISSDAPLTNSSVRDKALIRYIYSGSAQLEQKPSIWSADYIPGSLIPTSVAADSFPETGRKGFIAWMKDRCSVTQTESIQHHLGVDDVWRKLNVAFSILTGVIYYEPIMRKFLQKFFTTLVEDGVRWVEFRSAPFTAFTVEKAEKASDDPDVLLGVLSEEIEKFKASDAGKGFWGARMIWASLRFWPTEKIIQGD
jgi:adenosine deaminase CECR1